MRTQKEIAAHYAAGKKDLFGFEGDVLLPYLDAEHAAPFRKEGADPWEPSPLTEEAVLAEAKDYAKFGWGKIENHRGLSASRTIIKMSAWVWILAKPGHEKLLADIESETIPYAQYGAPQLAAICEHLGFETPDEAWATRMREGLACEPNCGQGC